MKKILVFLSMLFAFIGCNKENAPETEFVEKEKYNYFSVNIVAPEDVKYQILSVFYDDENGELIKEDFKNTKSSTWSSKEYKVLKTGSFLCAFSANTEIKNSKIKIQLLSKGKVIKEKEILPVEIKTEGEVDFWTIIGSISSVND